MLQRVTWRWLRSRLDGAHLVHHQLLPAGGRNFAGFDRDSITADGATSAPEAA